MLSADGTLSENQPMRRGRNLRTTLFVRIVGVLWRVEVFRVRCEPGGDLLHPHEEDGDGEEGERVRQSQAG